jgi:NAD(P)H-nitrite reductase large subunit
LNEKEALCWTGEIIKESKDFNTINKCSVSINSYIAPKSIESSYIVIDCSPSGNDFIFMDFFKRFRNYVLGNEALAMKQAYLIMHQTENNEVFGMLNIYI